MKISRRINIAVAECNTNTGLGLGFPGDSDGKESACNEGDPG